MFVTAKQNSKQEPVTRSMKGAMASVVMSPWLVAEKGNLDVGQRNSFAKKFEAAKFRPEFLRLHFTTLLLIIIIASIFTTR